MRSLLSQQEVGLSSAGVRIKRGAMLNVNGGWCAGWRPAPVRLAAWICRGGVLRRHGSWWRVEPDVGRFAATRWLVPALTVAVAKSSPASMR